VAGPEFDVLDRDKGNNELCNVDMHRDRMYPIFCLATRQSAEFKLPHLLKDFDNI
jgi:hypothetical protein